MKSLIVGIATPLLAFATSAAAQPSADDSPPILPNKTTGIALALGGGITDFTNDSLQSNTGLGATWDVRLTLGARSIVALELSYIGSAQSVHALGTDDSTLVGNGGQAVIRVNAPSRSRAITPFLFAGAAWRHYNMTNVDTATSDITDSDDVFEAPLGAGISARTGMFLIDLRGEYRWSGDSSLMPNLRDVTLNDSFDDRASMDRWGVTLTAGVEI